MDADHCYAIARTLRRARHPDSARRATESRDVTQHDLGGGTFMETTQSDHSVRSGQRQALAGLVAGVAALVRGRSRSEAAQQRHKRKQ